ncbi:hypothetical protein QJS83_02285 [Bdellovibrio sp. 22V]|uniref:hypothetical protein n=1 Tax=Bdellovibrio TaxID=958 RepID=UPI0025433765|nr:hypothetical protein [Bdellovibrio sp. 22V]WII72697.1 hypothetical protein QJS83_02285 [Bdellovibrio sp. 22V]
MGKNLIKLACILSLSFSPVAFAESPTKTPTTPTKESGSKGVETKTPTPVSQPSVNNSADNTKSQNDKGQAMSFLQGAMHIAMGVRDLSTCCNTGCQSGCVTGPIQIGMGLLSLAQGKQHGKSSGMAGITGLQSDGLGLYDGADTNPLDLDNPKNPLNKDPAFNAVKGNLAQLQKNGLYDPKTGKIKTPMGKEYNVSDFASKEAMAAAGFPQGAIDGAYAFASDASKKAADKADKLKIGAMTASNGYEEGGGGGLGSAPPMEDDLSGGVAGYSGAGEGLGRNALDRDPSSLAGMQKNYNGEPIGVAADSIFLMMTRRYKVKESQESFYTDADLALQK